MASHEHLRKQPPVTITRKGWSLIITAAISLVALMIWSMLRDHGGEPAVPVGELPRAWGLGLIPFLGILAAIAILPLVPRTHHWWESNANRLRVSLFCAGLTLLYVLWAYGLKYIGVTLEHAILDEYIPFIMLLLSLYVISGGISLTGDLKATPFTNTMFLLVGAGIASFIGTTGASMLLIRPLLQTNSERKHVQHTVIFFMFLVSNIGGCLLPVGDPPLFLGYLKGVPFFWTLILWKEWAVCCVILLIVYFVWDTIQYKRETVADLRHDLKDRKPLRLRGSINFLWMTGAVLAVATVSTQRPLPGTTWVPFPYLREIILLGFIALSLWTTPHGLRKENEFNYAAILEVAALFLGIFVAMQVPLKVLAAIGTDLVAGGIDQPWHYFWLTGGLSSFLDNAPTYAVFFELGVVLPTPSDGSPSVTLANGKDLPEMMLIAISLGAVFMGAMTYIGNGPNFMVKSIAEQSGIPMPSFFGYMFKYSLPILVPVFVLITVLFLR